MSADTVREGVWQAHEPHFQIIADNCRQLQTNCRQFADNKILMTNLQTLKLLMHIWSGGTKDVILITNPECFWLEPISAAGRVPGNYSPRDVPDVDH